MRVRKERNGKGDSKNRSERLIRNTVFDPEKYGMVICPVCKGNGYVKNPKRQCCPKCGGFGFIKKARNNEGKRDQ
jgi:DnaJ-class molecular chaperone